MTIAELKQLQVSGNFHHATYRDIGKIWEGLYIYRKDESANGYRGFSLAGSFNVRDAELEEAMSLCSGVSVGAYGEG